VKLVLMDQTVVAGVGNVQAMEALWRAGIHPSRPADSLTTAEHARLAEAVHEQLNATLALLGPGDEITYVEEPGGPNPFPLYQRDGEPCPTCGATIATFRQGGRGTWWCPGCQPSDTRTA
jgi:formamidopyrimidine-DNA glycosylase